jgi:hypothetical protein
MLGLFAIPQREDRRDGALVRAIMKDDFESYMVLIRRHQDFTNAVGIKLMGNKAAGMDLATLTLISVWVHRKRIPRGFKYKKARFEFYLFRLIKIYYRQNSVHDKDDLGGKRCPV